MIANQEKTNGQSTRTPGQNLEALFESIEAFSTLKFELIKLQSLQTVTRVSASLVFRVFFCALLFLFILMLSTGIAFFLGNVLEQTYLGFLIVAGFYLIVLIIFPVFLRPWLRKFVSRAMIKEILQ